MSDKGACNQLSFFSFIIISLSLAGVDFTATSNIVIFNDTNTINEVDLILIDDNILEGDENFTVLLQILTTRKDVIFPCCDATIVTIVDDDSKASLWH